MPYLNPNIFMKYFSTLLVSLLFSSSAIAVPDIQEAPAYKVEILVFKNLQIDEQDSELWVKEIAPDKQPDLTNAAAVGGGIPAETEIRKAFDKMLESGKYMLITHKRWIQDAMPKADARLIRIANGEAKLDGAVHFYKDRYLHLDVNLMLGEEFMPALNNAASSNAGASESMQNNFIINEHRKIRSRKINYFDHPRFGVIIQVDPVSVSKR